MAEAPSLYVVTVSDLFAIVSVLFVTSINTKPAPEINVPMQRFPRSTEHMNDNHKRGLTLFLESFTFRELTSRCMGLFKL